MSCNCTGNAVNAAFGFLVSPMRCIGYYFSKDVQSILFSTSFPKM